MEDSYSAELWLALNRVPGLGPVHTEKLLSSQAQLTELFESPETFQGFQGLPLPVQDILKALSRQKQSHPIRQQAQRELAYLDRQGVHLIHVFSALYPFLLKQTHARPPVLFAHGDPYLLSECQLAVVGARKAGKYALSKAKEISGELAQNGVVITSGMAMGIDTAAHQGALEAGGKTIAVLAHGIDQCYPARNKKLYEEIAEKGCLLTEFPVGVLPRREYFPRRNRIISGLSEGVFVVEAAIKSGTLSTARLAMEQNRDVFAMPGLVSNPLTEGCHHLIKDGAALVESAEDILGVLGIEPSHPTDDQEPKLPQTESNILEKMSFEPEHMDMLVVKTGMDVASLMPMLMELELKGYIQQEQGKLQRVK